MMQSGGWWRADMREIIEEAHKHMDDGYGRAQAHTKIQLPKRFYKKAEVGETAEGFSILLDGRATKTPGRIPVLLPSRDLAKLMAEEWQAQESHIDAASMPVVRLVNSAVEGGKAALGALRGEILSFAGNDLLLFRADSPAELVALQEKHWDAMLTKISRHFSVKFRPVVGVIHQDQPEATLRKLKSSLSDLNHFAATALMSITGLTGSGLLAIALRHGLADGTSVWEAAHVDEDYNARVWGADGEAEARLEKRRAEFDAALKVLALVDKV
ncbi:MAG TPA: ATPase [Devosia sp.]|nr:ATPase [Devosia sp.]